MKKISLMLLVSMFSMVLPVDLPYFYSSPEAWADESPTMPSDSTTRHVAPGVPVETFETGTTGSAVNHMNMLLSIQGPAKATTTTSPASTTSTTVLASSVTIPTTPAIPLPTPQPPISAPAPPPEGVNITPVIFDGEGAMTIPDPIIQLNDTTAPPPAADPVIPDEIMDIILSGVVPPAVDTASLVPVVLVNPPSTTVAPSGSTSTTSSAGSFVAPASAVSVPASTTTASFVAAFVPVVPPPFDPPPMPIGVTPEPPATIDVDLLIAALQAIWDYYFPPADPVVPPFDFMIDPNGPDLMDPPLPIDMNPPTPPIIPDPVEDPTPPPPPVE